MILFKACPRCRGDMVRDSDQYGRFTSCLACGYVGYPDVGAEIGRPLNGASVQWVGEVGGFPAAQVAQGSRGRMAACNWAAVTS